MIPLKGAEVEVSRVAFRIHEELVKPLRDLDITDKEFACLRSIVFFAPGKLNEYIRGWVHVLISAIDPDLLHQNKSFVCRFSLGSVHSLTIFLSGFQSKWCGFSENSGRFAKIILIC